MSEISNAQIILSAAIIAGKGASDADVKQEVVRLARFVSPGSLMHGAFYEAEKQAANTADMKVFTGTVLHVDRETTSNRFVLVLKTPISKFNAIGQETIRTDIDGGEGSVGRNLAQAAMQMIGHKVAVSVAIEQTKTGMKARVLRDIEDKGVDSEYAAAPSTVLWDQLKIDTSKLQTFNTAA